MHASLMETCMQGCKRSLRRRVEDGSEGDAGQGVGVETGPPRLRRTPSVTKKNYEGPPRSAGRTAWTRLYIIFRSVLVAYGRVAVWQAK